MDHHTRRFAYFAFRQLRRIPEEWRAHYRYELVNQLAQNASLSSHPDPVVSSQPEYWKLNKLKRGYHGVKWVLSRFDLECPELPEMFRDEEAEIHTNEMSSNVYARFKAEKLLPHDDPYLKPRTMSPFEAALIQDPNSVKAQQEKAESLLLDLGQSDTLAHRFVEPSQMTEEDLKDDEHEAAFGGTFYGTEKGLPDGFSEEEAEYEAADNKWHSNTTADPDRLKLRDYARVIRDDKMAQESRFHQKASFNLSEGTQAPTRRWTKAPDGSWVRNAEIFYPDEGVAPTPPPGIFGNDY